MKKFYLLLVKGFVLSAIVMLGSAVVSTMLESLLRKTLGLYLPSYVFLFLIAAAVAIFADTFTAMLRDGLREAAVLDSPNQRSMHAAPVPRGGGWCFVIPLAFVLAALGIIGGLPLDEFDPDYCAAHAMTFCFLWHRAVLPLVMLAGLMILALISWLDDRRGVSAKTRLLTQICVVVATGFFMPLPMVNDSWEFILAFLLVVAWVGFINVFNFMDGIDGIAGIETMSIALGILVTTSLQPYITAVPDITRLLAPLLVALPIGFLRHNWHPGKIFMGDVGSIPLGYLLGFCLLTLVPTGHWYIAATLPLYYLADGGITLLRRLVRGERIWEAHRTHFYQRAAQAAGRHDVVVIKIACCNLALIAIAVVSLLAKTPLICLAAPLVVALLLHNLAHQRHIGAKSLVR